jgi:hypothetical protein
VLVLAECLDDHEDDVNILYEALVYLTDSGKILQAIHRWIGCGAKLNLSKSPDADVAKMGRRKKQEVRWNSPTPAGMNTNGR